MTAARVAEVPAVGVAWGISPAADLLAASATAVVGRPAELRELLWYLDGA